MNIPIIVNYKFTDISINRDLVCELTQFFDKYLLKECSNYDWYKSYLYNDLIVNKDNNIQIIFRVPGATRGSIHLSRIDKNRFKIINIYFIDEQCFGKFGCYDIKLKEDSKRYIGSILDFSNVQLINNK